MKVSQENSVVESRIVSLASCAQIEDDTAVLDGYVLGPDGRGTG